MKQTTLNQLLKNVDHIQIIGSPTITITDITNDSRQVQSGSLFIAVPGFTHDGHQFISEAVKAGARAVVVEKKQELDIPQVIVSNARVAQAGIACNYFENPSRSLKITGITGTNGKTTTTFMLDSIFNATGLSTGLTGTLYNKIDGKILPTVNTTPDSVVCQRLLRNMVDAGVSHVSMEVSSHAMVMNRLDGTNFTVAGITNFSPDHLDLHKDMDDYRHAKQRYFKMLDSRATAVVNIDDQDCLRIVQDTAAGILLFSFHNPRADIFIQEYNKRGNETRLLLKINSNRLPVENDLLPISLSVPGEHNIANALVATSSALALGLDFEAIKLGLASFKGLYRRFETIYDDKFRVIDDATHNPANMDAVFSALKDEKPQGLTVVYAIRGNRGVDINRSIAKTLRNWTQKVKPHKLIITRCEDTAGPLDKVKPEEEKAFLEELGSLKFKLKSSLKESLEEALRTVKTGDTLLLMGAHPMDDVSGMFTKVSGIQTSTLPRPPKFGTH